MNDREHQTEFLRNLMCDHDCDEGRQLQVRMSKAQRDDLCIRSAMGLVVAIGLLAAAGLGYSAVLVPASLENTGLAVEILGVILIASAICLAGFLVFWYWHRGRCDGLYRECRNFVLLHQKSRPGVDPAGFHCGKGPG